MCSRYTVYGELGKVKVLGGNLAGGVVAKVNLCGVYLYVTHTVADEKKHILGGFRLLYRGLADNL